MVLPCVVTIPAAAGALPVRKDGVPLRRAAHAARLRPHAAADKFHPLHKVATNQLEGKIVLRRLQRRKERQLLHQFLPGIDVSATLRDSSRAACNKRPDSFSDGK